MNINRAVLVIAAALVLTGCAGLPNVKMSKTDRVALKTVKVIAPADVPNDMFFHGKAQSCAMAFGPGLLGAAVCPKPGAEPKEQIIELMKANNISLAEIVRTEFQKAIVEQSVFAVATGDQPADADIQVHINMYGLGQTQGFSSLLYPLMNLSVSMKKPDGSVVWQATDFITPQNSQNDAGYEFEKYVQEPDKLREIWTNVAGALSRMLLEDLPKT